MNSRQPGLRVSLGQRIRSNGQGQLDLLSERVAQLEEDIKESRRLNERLSDVLDVVVELLVPAVDRDDERLREALHRLGKTVSH